jgi:MFS family permease
MTFFVGFGMAGRMFVGFVYLSEHLKKEDVAKATAVMFVIDALCIFWSALYFKFISKDWKYLYGLTLFMLFISTCLLILQDETPKFYYGRRDFDRAR